MEERQKPRSDPATQVEDDDLDRVATVLHAAMRMRPDRGHGGCALAEFIGRAVTDRWSQI